MRDHLSVAGWARASLKTSVCVGLAVDIVTLSYFAPHSWIATTKPFASFPTFQFFVWCIPVAVLIVVACLVSMYVSILAWSLLFSYWVPVRTQRALVRIELKRSTGAKSAIWLLRHVPWGR